MLDRFARFLFKPQHRPENLDRSAVPVTSSYPSAEDFKIQGNRYLNDGDPDAAADCYRQAIATDPEYAEAYNNLAFLALRKGDFAEAQAFADRALALNPRLPSPHLNLAAAHEGQGHLDDAAKAYRLAIELRTDMVAAYDGLARVLAAQGDDPGMLALLRDAIALHPGVAALRTLLADTCVRMKHFAEAVTHLRAALQLDAGLEGPIRSKLGALLQQEERFGEAQSEFQRALELDPSSPVLHVGLGDVLVAQGQIGEAVDHYRRALSLAPDDAVAFAHLGVALHMRGERKEALAVLHQAVKRSPSNEEFRFNRSLAYLADGQLPSGWKDYESRFVKHERASFPQPEWCGEDLRGKTLLIWAEQGIGDQVLFASMFGELIARTRRCIVECDAKLVPLFAHSYPEALVVPRTHPPHPAMLHSSIDFQSGAGSLAQWLRPTIDSFPAHDGYLTPDPARVALWRRRLAALGTGLKVGFSWTSHKTAGTRCLHYASLEQWQPIFTVRGIQFVNLQYGDCAEELQSAAQRSRAALHVFPEVDFFDDLAEGAALVKALDLVISAPTATSFLSAAVGVPTWMMVYSSPWQALGTHGIPWFPAMRCISRHWDQPWEDVISQVASDLAARSPESFMRQRCDKRC